MVTARHAETPEEKELLQLIGLAVVKWSNVESQIVNHWRCLSTLTTNAPESSSFP